MLLLRMPSSFCWRGMVQLVSAVLRNYYLSEPYADKVVFAEFLLKHAGDVTWSPQDIWKLRDGGFYHGAGRRSNEETNPVICGFSPVVKRQLLIP